MWFKEKKSTDIGKRSLDPRCWEWEKDNPVEQFGANFSLEMLFREVM